jgi:hypothetical protein
MPLPPNSQLKNSGYSRPAPLLILAAWLALLGLLFVNRQNLYDWLRLHNYHAPAVVAQLASQDTMTPYAKKVFYVNHPSLEDKAGFFKDCPAGSSAEQTIVLGCYHAGQMGIFLQDVNNPSLDGVEQVTAAHEMLHAAYDRLSPSDQSKVNAMLEDYYNNGLADQRIKDTIEAYKKTEPSDVINEMHSVFGSEAANLPAPLEQYYRRYFTNRQQVAAFAAQYQSAFTSRQATVAQDDAKLAQLKSRIDAGETDLKTKQVQISDSQSRLMALRGSGDTAGYNAGVPAYNALVDAYNSEVQQVRGLIAQYNELVSERNAIAFQENQLVQSLSSQPDTINR